MRKGEKDLVSAAADAEVGTAVHWGAGPVRISPVHAALQHSDAEDEVTTTTRPSNQLAILKTILTHLNVFCITWAAEYFPVSCCQEWSALSNLSMSQTRRWCGPDSSDRARGREKMLREETESWESRADSLGRVSYPGSGGGWGLTAGCCRHGAGLGEAMLYISVSMFRISTFNSVHILPQKQI